MDQGSFVYRVIAAHQGRKVGDIITDTRPLLNPYLVPVVPVVEEVVEPRPRKVRKSDGADGRVLGGVPEDGTPESR